MRRYMIKRAAQIFAAVGIALPAVLGMVTFTSTADAGFNVHTFTCTSGGDIRVDVRGLGNTNVCVDANIHVAEDCACVNNSGSCPQATNKQSTDTDIETSFVLQPRNGRVNTTLDSGIGGSSSCIAPPAQCGTGQTPKPINQSVVGTFTLCTTSAQVGDPCSCPTNENDPAFLASASGGGCTTTAHFESKNDSCDALFE